MVRGYHTRVASRSILGKRKRTGYASRPFKRRRVFSQKFKSSTSNQGAGYGLQFKSRRLRGRRWRSKLWNDTLAKSHWRSVAATTTTFSSNASSSSI